jgi:putative membrane protein
MNAARNLNLLVLWLLAGLLLSGIAPLHYGTWLLEVLPAIALLPILWFTRQHFPLTGLLYTLLGLHCLILFVGGHYTYARVPLGFWVRDALDLARNNFDRLGHFAQGFVPAIAARELLLRCTPLQRGGWLFVLVTACCLAISACYEFIEWWSALLLGSGADEFLATQGDIWDTQWDMLCAGIGAVTAQLLLARWHDRQLQQVPGQHQTGDWQRWNP